MSDTTVNRFLAIGTTAERMAFVPNPATPASGPAHLYLWYDTDLSSIFYWDGAAWQSAITSAGTVTNTGTLTAFELIVGNGSNDITALGSVGATDEVLVGNTGANPSWGKVTEDHMSLSDVTTLNADTTQHGFLKKLPNDANQYMDGTGNWSTVSSTPPSLKVFQQERFI